MNPSQKNPPGQSAKKHPQNREKAPTPNSPDLSPIPSLGKRKRTMQTLTPCESICTQIPTPCESIWEIPEKKIKSRPPFLVINPTREGDTLNKMSVFAISKALKVASAGRPKTVKKLRSGQILVQVNGPKESENLQKVKIFGGTPVVVEPHKSLNRSKGVIKSRDLDGCTEKEMVEELEGVLEAQRVKIRRADKEILTNTWILTFDSVAPPPRLQIEYLNLQVRPYIPNPMRCFGCHRYGHTKTNCRRNAVCPCCGKEGHPEEDCNAAEPRCLNCQGKHKANSKDCPKWHQEKAILSYRATHGGTFETARAAVFPQGQQKVRATYSEVAAKRVEPKIPPSSAPAIKEKTKDKKIKKTNKNNETVRGKQTNMFAVLTVEGDDDTPSSTPLPTPVPSPLGSPIRGTPAGTSLILSGESIPSSQKSPPRRGPAVTPSKSPPAPLMELDSSQSLPNSPTLSQTLPNPPLPPPPPPPHIPTKPQLPPKPNPPKTVNRTPSSSPRRNTGLKHGLKPTFNKK